MSSMNSANASDVFWTGVCVWLWVNPYLFILLRMQTLYFSFIVVCSFSRKKIYGAHFYNKNTYIYTP